MFILTKPISEGISGPAYRRQAFPAWWTGFGLSLILPSSVLGFLATGPHAPLAALAWTTPIWLLVALDRLSPEETRIAPEDAPRWFFDGILYLLVLLQILNVLALGWLVSRLGWSTWSDVLNSLANLAVIRLMVSANFCCAAICPAHELIHRRNRWQRRLGRLLLVSVGYDHFASAHKGAHHARLGSADDPSTARSGESFEDFFRRTRWLQWAIAWRNNRRSVIAGVAVEAAWLAAFGLWFGPLAAAVMLREAFAAVRTLESVNYFQHYGLTEESGQSALTAWRNDSAVSLFLFLGLTRHADHHRRPGARYSQLVAVPDGPAMPYGYLGMAVWVQRRNESYRAWVASLGMTGARRTAEIVTPAESK